jgi:hypothetical protein
MPRKKAVLPTLPNDLELLDDLIRKCCAELCKSTKMNAKLGDFIKMIELRRELAPAKSDQQKFWEMLEGVRQATLQKKTQEPVKTPASKRKTS